MTKPGSLIEMERMRVFALLYFSGSSLDPCPPSEPIETVAVYSDHSVDGSQRDERKKITAPNQ